MYHDIRKWLGERKKKEKLVQFVVNGSSPENSWSQKQVFFNDKFFESEIILDSNKNLSWQFWQLMQLRQVHALPRRELRTKLDTHQKIGSLGFIERLPSHPKSDWGVSETMLKPQGIFSLACAVWLCRFVLSNAWLCFY